jgi:4-hydroxy-tetrahydrodipicolinate reductase
MVNNDTVVNVWIHGCTGRMGSELSNILSKETCQMTLQGGSGEQYWGVFDNSLYNPCPEKEAIARLLQCKLVIDFSSIGGNKSLYDIFSSYNIQSMSILIATTGLPEEQLALWKSLSSTNNLKIMFAPNTSYGVILVTRVCKSIAESLRNQGFDIELVEVHHRDKVDSPSGTAKFIAGQIADQEGFSLNFNRTRKREEKEIGVYGLRGGAVFGEHTIKFLGDFEEIEITHKARSRSLFAKGALILGRWLANRKHPGLYDLESFQTDS